MARACNPDRRGHRSRTPAATGPMSASKGAGCITEPDTPHGYWLCYPHSPGELGETLEMAIRIAGEVATEEARERGKTYVVASTPHPSPAVYVFACGHPDANNVTFSIV